MLRYETLVLTPPDITRQQIETLEGHVAALATKAQGKVLQFDEWGKCYLAYPVKKSNYGCYFLVRIEIPSTSASTAVKELSATLRIKCVDYVWRHVVKSLDASASLEYKRPDAISSTMRTRFVRKDDSAMNDGNDLDGDKVSFGDSKHDQEA
jgi:ribosomal protein S6